MAKWGIFAGNVLPSRDNKPCQYRLKLTLQRHLAHEARRGIIGQKTVYLDSINGTTLTPQVQGSNFPQFQGNGQQGKPQPWTTIGAVALNPFIPFVPSQNSSEQPQVVQDWTSVPPPQQYYPLTYQLLQIQQEWLAPYLRAF